MLYFYAEIKATDKKTIKLYHLGRLLTFPNSHGNSGNN